jgi:hypothetical protein
VAQDGGHGPGVEARVDGVEHGAGHWHREVRLVHGRHIGGQHGDHVVLAHAEAKEGRGQAAAAFVRLAPGEAHAAVDDGRAVAVHGIGAREETHRAQRHVVGKALRKLLHVCEREKLSHRRRVEWQTGEGGRVSEPRWHERLW